MRHTKSLILRIFSFVGNLSIWSRHIIGTSAVIGLSILAVAYVLVARNTDVAHKVAITEARSHFYDIQLMRKWNSTFTGIFVEKSNDIESNPYLDDPDIKTGDGVIYTRKPSQMTNEFLELLTKDGAFTFHVTSMNPINPANKADEFESTALRSFETGNKEAFVYETTDGKPYFRYMAPLFVENSCMRCHKKQGYQIGDVRGGISIRADVSDTQRFLAKSNTMIWIAAAFVICGLTFMLYLFHKKLMLHVDIQQKDLKSMAATDPLTNLSNRRHFSAILENAILRFETDQVAFSCIIIDIDHFKTVNDRYGHTAGDIVLKHVSRLLESLVRKTDTVSRYGGEEFIILAPRTSLLQATALAEKLRETLQQEVFDIGSETPLNITASFGVTSSDCFTKRIAIDTKLVIDTIDKALYKAKSGGRNKVVATT